jgi:membrane-associated protein
MVNIFDFIFHIADHLRNIVHDCGAWSYLILFVIIFAETGLVLTPFLPGDSLLFAAGALAAGGSFEITRLFLILVFAAVAGDSVNYAAGKIIGLKIFKEKARILKKEYLNRTHKFYEKYGGRTIILARFVPIIRTFAPFVAGAGQMGYPKFFKYNVIGGLLWVALFLFGGFYFGNLPVVKSNFTLVIGVIIILSVLPAVFEVMRHRKKA